MPRPQRCRRVCREPDYACFVPAGGGGEGAVVLSVDEFEVLRLVDYEQRTHEECARQMGVSRTTVTEIYQRARYKLADGLVNGRRVEISGGHYCLCQGDAPGCRGKHCRLSVKSPTTAGGKEGANEMKLAVTYENGQVFQHFGHTEQFKIYTVENGAVTHQRVVDTNGSGHGALAGFLQQQGVEVLICGGIGGGAQMALAQAGITLYGGVTGSADEAVQAWLAGKLDYDPDVHCDHHDHGQEGHTCGDHGCGGHSCV